MLGTGWKSSFIYRYRTGSYLTIAAGVDNSLSGIRAQDQRPDLVKEDTRVANPLSPCAGRAPCRTWLDSTAFRQSALGTFGNIGMSNVLGPAFFQLDTALSREFTVREGHTLEIRGEAFNVLNKVRPLNPATNLAATGTFGVILGAFDPRIMQFAIKYGF